MTPLELKALLEEVSPLVVVPKGQIDRQHPTVVKFLQVHFQLTGKKVGQGTCQSCILDALFELKGLTETQLKLMTMERKYKLKPNALVYFNHAHYTVANITDDVAIEMVKANSGHSRSFVNGEALLAELDGVEKTKSKRGRKPKEVAPEITETVTEEVTDGNADNQSGEVAETITTKVTE
jgi:hypothetical protein